MASIAQWNLLVLLALTFVVIGVNATYAPIFSLPSMFLGGPAAASGIALANAMGNLGGFLGPFVVGVLRDETNGYESGMRVLALGLVLAAITVLATGHMMSPRKVKVACAGRPTGS